MIIVLLKISYLTYYIFYLYSKSITSIAPPQALVSATLSQYLWYCSIVKSSSESELSIKGKKSSEFSFKYMAVFFLSSSKLNAGVSPINFNWCATAL